MKNIPLINLTSTHRDLEQPILAAIKSAYRRNAFVLADEVQTLERNFSRFCGARHGVGVSSGTAALELILRGLGIGPGDEVITTPFTFFASASAIAYTGAKPVFVDVEKGTLNLDPAGLGQALTSRTRAVMPVHLFGQPANMGEILAFARKNNLSVVEDACQAHGALYRGKPVGSLGTAAAFSFYPTKNLGGLGDGGLVTTDDEKLAETIRTLRNCGRRGQYEHVLLGYNERLDNIQAAALLVKLKKLSAWNRERRRVAAFYHRGLAGCPARPLDVSKDAEPVFHLFTVRAPRREELQKHLAAQGIASGVFYPVPLHLQKSFASLGGKKGDFPVAEAACGEVLSLPCYPGLKAGDIKRVVGAVREFYR